MQKKSIKELFNEFNFINKILHTPIKFDDILIKKKCTSIFVNRLCKQKKIPASFKHLKKVFICYECFTLLESF